MDNVAVAALVIALIALITAIGQLLQAYLGTADGYRRCQSSVMGDWAKKTRLRWRWGQFRFETLYTTPEICMTRDGLAEDGAIMILGDETSRLLTVTPREGFWSPPGRTATTTAIGHVGREKSVRNRLPKGKQKISVNPMDELVGWVPMLHWVHETTRASLESQVMPDPAIPSVKTPDELLKWTRIPALVLRERSWDFQPTDVIRPLAKSKLATIAILARRMGMRWKEFRPSDGIMRAEGHSHVITSTVVRGLGLVLQYNYTGRDAELSRPSIWRPPALAGTIYKEEEEIYIPTSGADRFGAGVVRGHRRLEVTDYAIGTQQEIITALNILGRSGIPGGALKRKLKEDPEFTCPVGDVVSLTAYMICQAGSSLVQIPAPSDNMDGITTDPRGRIAFGAALNEYVQDRGGSTTPVDAYNATGHQIGWRTCWVLWQMEALRNKFPDWSPTVSSDALQWAVRRPIDYLEALNRHFDEATDYFAIPLSELREAWRVYIDIEANFSKKHLKYAELLSAHIRFGFMGIALSDQNSQQTYQEQVEKYFAALNSIVDELKRVTGTDETIIVDSWVMMMFRAFCWGACHFFVPGERVPRAYFGSQLPVYIG